MNARAAIGVAAAILCFALVVGIAPTGDPDLWWHLKTGQIAATDPASLARDLFSYSRAGEPWRYHDLWADEMLYRGWLALGFAWFVVLKIVVVGVLASAVTILRRNALFTIVGTVLLLLAIHLVERPNLFTVACFPLFLALLERARRTERYVAVVILAWLWICLHRGGVIAIPLLAASSIFVSIAQRKPSWPALGSTLALACLSLLNPSGIDTFRSSFGVVGSDALRQTISEWQRLGPFALVRTFPFPIALATMALVAVVWRRAFWMALLLVGFSTATLDSVRWVPYLATVAVLALAETMPTLPSRRELRLLPLLATVAGLALLFLSRSTPFAIGEDPLRTPVEATRFLEREDLQGEVVNALEHGGYLIWRSWPRVHVLVDGRNETVYPPQLMQDALTAEHDRVRFQAMRKQDRASIVFAANAPGRLSHAFLADDPAWALVEWTEPATVWVRIDDHPSLTTSRFRYIDPRAIDSSVAKVFASSDTNAIAALGAELQRMIDASPDSVRALVGLAIYDHLHGDRDARDLVMHRLEELAPTHPAVRELRRRFQRS